MHPLRGHPAERPPKAIAPIRETLYAHSPPPGKRRDRRRFDAVAPEAERCHVKDYRCKTGILEGQRATCFDARRGIRPKLHYRNVGERDLAAHEVSRRVERTCRPTRLFATEPCYSFKSRLVFGSTPVGSSSFSFLASSACDISVSLFITR